MKHILILFGIIFCFNASAYEQNGIKDGIFYRFNAGTNPFNQCGKCNMNGYWQQGGCPNAKPCCDEWIVKEIDEINFLPYYNYECKHWHMHEDYYPDFGDQNEECLKYEIVQYGGKYTNECVKWKYYDGDMMIIHQKKGTEESMDFRD